MVCRIILVVSAMSCGLSQCLVQGAQAPTAKPKAGNLGTTQMAGADGQFGATYTLKDGPNFTLLSAQYTVERFGYNRSTVVPKADEKILLLHFRVKNPRPRDMYLNSNFVTFQTVGADDKTISQMNAIRRAGDQEALAVTLKPGQGLDDLVMPCVVPANSNPPKLILNAGRDGTSQKVIRYLLGTGKNIVKPLAAPYAKAASTTPPAPIPAVLGQSYPAGYLDLTVTRVAYQTEPIMKQPPGEGQRYFVAIITVKNRSFFHDYVSSTGLKATLRDSDGEKTDFKGDLLKASRDETIGQMLEPGEEYQCRCYFSLPTKTEAKTLTLAEAVDNTGGLSRAYAFDVGAGAAK